MSHARKQIRTAIADLLRTDPSTWRENAVQETRIESSRQIWPYLMVFADEEVSSKDTISEPAVMERTFQLFIVGMLKLPGTGDTQTIEDQMDAMATEIETTLKPSAVSGVLPKVVLSLVSTKPDVINETDGIDHGQLHMTWEVSYSTISGTPESMV
jgi:hypothetical protein